MLEVDHLPWTVCEVGAQGKADGAAAPDDAVEQCDVGLSDGAMQELLLQMMIGIIGQCHHHQSAGVLVEAVHHIHLAVPLAKHALHRRLVGLAGHAEQSRRFVDNDDMLVFLNDF